MATMLVEVYDALRDAGASEEKSRAAAIANYGNRFNKVEADLLVLKWMIGAVLAGVVSLVSKTFI